MAKTKGLSDAVLQKFSNDKQLLGAVEQATALHSKYQKEYPDLLKLPEAECVQKLQRHFLNFYDNSTINPYVALAAQGPWIVTSYGSVVYDSGGYGMLAFGHNPPSLLEAVAQPQVMANVMTANFAQRRLIDKLSAEIGHSRPNKENPYEAFVCLNSGSECNSLAMRIMDVDVQRMTHKACSLGPNCKNCTDIYSCEHVKEGPHLGREGILVSLKGSFHGRTEGPASASDSCQPVYRKYLASYRRKRQLRTVVPNDISHLRAVFDEIESDNLHPEMMLMEPVMGEGSPGTAISREFYDEARKLTEKYRSLLLVDSIQAGFRAFGVMSLMDYPGFQDAVPPDFETFSKCINGGQFPLSVLALGPKMSSTYVKGLYGNTMTTNPRALDVMSGVLSEFTPELRDNVRSKGVYLRQLFEQIAQKHPDAVEKVTGTGLIVAVHMNKGWEVVAPDLGLETVARTLGLGIIHGGTNAIRFTPHLKITKEECDLIAALLEQAIAEYGRLKHGKSKQ